MTKPELIQLVADKSGATHAEAQEAAEVLFVELTKVLAKEGRFSWPGFGTFTVRSRKARMGINPQTKQPLKIKASKTVGFKPAPALKDSL